MDPGQEITHAYFLETGLASVVVAMADGSMVETGITGNDGLVGFPVLLGTKTIPTRTFMQIPGNGFRIKAQHLINEFERSGALQKKINRYFQAHLVQTGQTAACNRLHDIAERLGVDTHTAHLMVKEGTRNKPADFDARFWDILKKNTPPPLRRMKQPRPLPKLPSTRCGSRSGRTSACIRAMTASTFARHISSTCNRANTC